MCFTCIPLIGYVPLSCFASLNLILSLTLYKTVRISGYGPYSRYYRGLIIGVGLLMTFVDITWCILVTVPAFWVIYMSTTKNEEFDYSVDEEGYTVVVLKGWFCFRRMKNVVKKVKEEQLRRVVVDFKHIVHFECNYFTQYKQPLEELESLLTVLKITGLEGRGQDLKRNNLLSPIQVFNKRFL